MKVWSQVSKSGSDTALKRLIVSVCLLSGFAGAAAQSATVSFLPGDISIIAPDAQFKSIPSFGVYEPDNTDRVFPIRDSFYGLPAGADFLSFNSKKGRFYLASQRVGWVESASNPGEDGGKREERPASFMQTVLAGNVYEVSGCAPSQHGANCELVQNEVKKSSVPIPAAFWLFGSALIGFILASNRRSL